MLVEFNIDAEKSFIGSWFLKDLTLCDRLVEFFETNESKRPGEVIDESGQCVIKKNIKDSIDLKLSPENNIALEYVAALQEAVELYKEKYMYCNHTAPWEIEAVNIQKYNPNGGYFRWHFERTTGSLPTGTRHLVFLTYLTDVTDEGETEFFYQNVKIQPRKGLTLIWPVDWTHTHRGIPSPTQDKYVITGWFHFSPE